MFELPLGKNFSSGSNFNPNLKITVPAYQNDCQWLDLQWSRVGPLIHGTLVISPLIATGSVIFTLPIREALSVTAAPADGSPVPVTLTLSTDANGYVCATGSYNAEVHVVNFIGSDGRGLTIGTPLQSRYFALDQGKAMNFKPVIDSGAAAVLSDYGGHYQHITPTVKALYGSFEIDAAGVVKVPLPVGTQVLGSQVTRAGSVSYTGSVTPGVGGVLFGGLAATDIYHYYILVREKR